MSPSACPPELVVEAQPPEQDLDFTIGLHLMIVQTVNTMTSR
jgi:hypothetical protein